MPANDGVSIAMVLLKRARTNAARSLALAEAQALGLIPTTAGAASLCFRADPETFAQVFGVQAVRIDPVAASESDFGAPAGYGVDGNLVVPQALQEYVSQVTVSSPALRLSEAV